MVDPRRLRAILDRLGAEVVQLRRLAAMTASCWPIPIGCREQSTGCRSRSRRASTRPSTSSAWWSGGEHRADRGDDRVELAVGEGKRRCVRLDPLQRHPQAAASRRRRRRARGSGRRRRPARRPRPRGSRRFRCPHPRRAPAGPDRSRRRSPARVRGPSTRSRRPGGSHRASTRRACRAFTSPACAVMARPPGVEIG